MFLSVHIFFIFTAIYNTIPVHIAPGWWVVPHTLAGSPGIAPGAADVAGGPGNLPSAP